MFLLVALAAAAVTIPSGPELTRAITERDVGLFHTFFDECDPPKMATFLAPDLEFYHDKGGKVADSAKGFVDMYAQQCAARAQPGAPRSRRELVVSSLNVEAIPGFGAIEEGDHLFYERQGDGPEHLAGKAHFVHLWQLGEDGVWRAKRVFSYSHRPVSQPRHGGSLTRCLFARGEETYPVLMASPAKH